MFNLNVINVYVVSRPVMKWNLRCIKWRVTSRFTRMKTNSPSDKSWRAVIQLRLRHFRLNGNIGIYWMHRQKACNQHQSSFLNKHFRKLKDKEMQKQLQASVVAAGGGGTVRWWGGWWRPRPGGPRSDMSERVTLSRWDRCSVGLA